MKSWYPSVVLAFAFAAAMRAQTAPPPLQCSASAPAVPAVRVEGGAELVGDYVVTCTGGTPTGAQQTVPAVTVTLSANTNITSRLLAAGWSEALLLVDEPAAGSQLACATTNGTCTILGVANGKGTYSGVTGRPNIFQGQQPFNQQLIFVFPFDPPGANTRYLRFTNVRVNALALGTPANVTLSSLASNGISISNPAQNVALTQPSASFDTRFVESGRNGLADFTLSFTERFAAAVKTRTLAAYANTETSPAPVNQNVPGQPAPGTETGFYNNSLPNISGHGNLGVAGLADNGSRFLVTVSRIPSGVTVFTAPSVNLSRQFQNTGVLRLISADATGRGPFSPAGACCAANVALTTDANGTAQAVFEVLSTAPAQLEIADIPFLLSYSTGAPAVTSLSVTAALAPTSTAATADLTAPLPRFNSPVAISLSAIGITPTSIPQGVPGSPYSVQFAASGGSPPYFWTTPATLPPGLTLSANGVLSGTPPSAGSYPVTITATDSVQAAAIYQYTLW